MQATKKIKLEGCPSNQVSAAANLPVGTKKGHLSIVFSVQRTGGSPTGKNPENVMVYQDT
jgi:hypothetical protein